MPARSVRHRSVPGRTLSAGAGMRAVRTTTGTTDLTGTTLVRPPGRHDGPPPTMAHPPYKAQLEQFLSANPKGAFSARSLAEHFGNGTRDEMATLRGIESELRKAFADGRLVQYHDAAEQLVTEPAAANINSKRLRSPAFYGLAGASPPPQAVMEVVYSADTQPRLNGTAVDDSDDSDDSTDGGAAGSDAAPSGEHDDDTEPQLTSAVALQRLMGYPPAGSTAPSWVDDRILRIWASLAGVSKYLVSAVESGNQDKLELIRAGVTRKLRGGWRSESLVAGNLATLCRRSATVSTTPTVSMRTRGHLASIPSQRHRHPTRSRAQPRSRRTAGPRWWRGPRTVDGLSHGSAE